MSKREKYEKSAKWRILVEGGVVSRLFFISTDGPMAVQMSFICDTEQVVMIAESFLNKSVFPGAPLVIGMRTHLYSELCLACLDTSVQTQCDICQGETDS